MKKMIFFVLVILLSIGNSHSKKKKSPSEGDPVPKEISKIGPYGYSKKNPIKVGRKNGGPKDEEIFLNSIMGPDGQKITNKRVGSCCKFKTPNALFGDKALLDQYEVIYDGQEKSITLYFNMYDYEQPKAPKGFLIKKEK